MAIKIIDKQRIPNEVTYTSEELMAYIGGTLMNPVNYGYDHNPDIRIPYVDSVLCAARQLVMSGKFIQAIKLVKSMFPMGLKEAKDFCEAEFAEERKIVSKEIH